MHVPHRFSGIGAPAPLLSRPPWPPLTLLLSRPPWPPLTLLLSRPLTILAKLLEPSPSVGLARDA